MKRALGLGWVVVALASVIACGSEGGGTDGDDGASSSSGSVTSSSGGTSSGASGKSSSGGTNSGSTSNGSSGASGTSSGQTESAVALDQLGVWSVSGSDARGTFSGEIELTRRADGSLHFARTIVYAGITVEDGKELHLAWTGTLTEPSADAASLTGALDPRGFILLRGDTVHTLDSAVTPTAAQVTRNATDIAAAWTIGAETFSETWQDHRASGATPIFENQRVLIPAHAPPSSATKNTLFATYAEFQAQPLMAPYTERPDFQAAIFKNIVDTTDADFYRQKPNALRIVDRPVDPISLLEAERRRSAYAPTLEAKANAFDADMEAVFLEDGLWFSPHSVGNGQPGSSYHEPSGDGSLWTGSYVMSQVQRYQVTGSAQALLNLEHSVGSMAKLQEITFDPTQFARTLRKTEPDLTGGWHHGIGPFADLDWQENGNNDMFSGLMLTYVFAYPLLCEGPLAATHDALCTRLRNNIDHLTDLSVAASGNNKLDANWLKAIVFPTDLGARAKAEAAWQQEKAGNRFYAVDYTYGIGADWSGTNLTFAGVLAESVMARRLELGGDAIEELGSFIDRSQESVKDQRLATWHLLRKIYGATPPNDLYVLDAKWRLREMPTLKAGVFMSHLVSPEFSLAPYPTLPWKNDWHTPGMRLQGLYNYPLFEGPADVFVWRLGLDFASDGSNRKYPGTDYLYLYWLARQAGILAAGE